MGTVGDAMIIFYLLKEKLGMDFSYTATADGNLDPSSIHIHFKNDKINSCLERVITEEIMAEQLKQSIGEADDVTSTKLLADKFLLDLTKEELCKSKDVL